MGTEIQNTPQDCSNPSRREYIKSLLISTIKSALVLAAAAELAACASAPEPPKEFDPYDSVPLARYYPGRIRIKLPEATLRTGPTTSVNQLYWPVSRDKIHSLNYQEVDALSDTIIVTNAPITYGRNPNNPPSFLQEAPWVVLMGEVDMGSGREAVYREGVKSFPYMDLYAYLGPETQGIIDCVDSRGKVIADRPTFFDLKRRKSDGAYLGPNDKPIPLGSVSRVR
jgi:hypothetical protein